MTDHASLENIKIQTTLSRRQARWLEVLQSHEFDVKYKPRKTNVVADALSRMPQISTITTISTELINEQDLIQAYQQDNHLSNILETLQNPNNANKKQLAQVKNYQLINNHIYIKDGMRLVLPRYKELITKILQENHDSKIAGHLGDKTYKKVSRSYFWSRMSKDIKKYVATCESCQRNKSSNQQPAGLLQPLSTSTTRWKQITMDFIVQLPKTIQEFDAIVVFVDRLSKRAHFVPLTIKSTAPDVAKIFFENVFKYHGLPKVIVSDRDPKFTSKF